jgi:hypothetical protein
MLASPWFSRALKKEGWSESDQNEKDGLIHISASDWDAEAFLILLNVLHLRNRSVPDKVSLDMLAKIAVLVDYYECDEPFFSLHQDVGLCHRGQRSTAHKLLSRLGALDLDLVGLWRSRTLLDGYLHSGRDG